MEDDLNPKIEDDLKPKMEDDLKSKGRLTNQPKST